MGGGGGEVALRWTNGRILSDIYGASCVYTGKFPLSCLL